MEVFTDVLGLGLYFSNNGNGALRYYPGLFPIPFGKYKSVTRAPLARAVRASDPRVDLGSA